MADETSRRGGGPEYFAADLLEGRAAFITGGGTGLGFAIARAFAGLGARVALASRSAEHVEPAAERLRAAGGEAIGLTCDVRDPEQVRRAVDAAAASLDGLDILVNNAAGNFLVRAEELSVGGWKAVTRIVLDGTFFCSQAALPHMTKRGGGSILNVIATYAESAGPLTVHSAAAKAGVLSLTRTLAFEWARYGVRVNAVAPGPVDTEGAGSRLWDSPEARAMIEEAVPLGRFGAEDDVAAAAVYLVSDAASYVSGALLAVDGGLTVGRGHFLDEGVAVPLLRKPTGG